MIIVAVLTKGISYFPSYFYRYGAMKVVMIVIVPTIGNMKDLVAPTSAPPLATTKASSPPEDADPNPNFKELTISIC